jgi:hypothetical protein
MRVGDRVRFSLKYKRNICGATRGVSNSNIRWRVSTHAPYVNSVGVIEIVHYDASITVRWNDGKSTGHDNEEELVLV